MTIKTQTSDFKQYLKSSEIIDFDSQDYGEIRELADEIEKISSNKIDYIKNAYEYVRDKIAHSADINQEAVTCSACEVLKERHGICFAKSHLFAALLRYKGVPTGFCYQKLILDDAAAPILVWHGLNGVYVEAYDKWIRLDARGNRDEIHAQFSICEEKLAFPVRSEKGERDIPIVFCEPHKSIISLLHRNKSRKELWADLATPFDIE